MLKFMKNIENELHEAFVTDDYIVINAIFRELKLSSHLRPRIKRLTDMGIIEHIGRNKYVLARGLYEATDNSGVHTRIIGLDRDTNKELILQHIRKNGAKGTPFYELEQVLPGLSRRQIQLLLGELKDDKKVVMAGKTSAAKWHISQDKTL
jgi:ATP-dependent DNA helicase RecG